MRILYATLLAALGGAAAGSPAMAAEQFGAMSYSRSLGTYAVALNHATRAGAEHTALATCRRASRDCSTPVWVQNGCVSIAIGQAHGFGSGWGSTPAAAEQEAMDVCHGNARNCAVRKTACTRQ